MAEKGVGQIHYCMMGHDFTGMVLPDKNVLFNVLRLNRGYLERVGWFRALFMFGSATLLSALLALPVLLWTVITQLSGRAGTMVFVAKPQTASAQ